MTALRGWKRAAAFVGIVLVGFAAAVLGVAGTVAAQAPAATAIGPEQASILAGNCFNCHGTDGVAPPGAIPAIAGMPAEAMVAQLKAFRADLVPGATIMGRIALGYSDAEMEAIARYFAERGR